MDNLNYQLYDEFTKLNKACITIYQMEEGIADYMEAMASVSSAYWDVVPNWNLDLEQLHRYQTVYRSLAQSMAAFGEHLCCQEDVDWLRQFRTRIMERKDPLAQLQERGYRAEDDARQRIEDDRDSEIMMQTINPRDRYVNVPFVLWTLVIAMVLTCVICLFLLRK